MIVEIKYAYIVRDVDTGLIEKAGIRFNSANKQAGKVSRLGTLSKVVFPALPHHETKVAADGQEIFIFTEEHLGRIKTDAELNAALSKLLTSHGVTEVVV